MSVDSSGSRRRAGFAAAVAGAALMAGWPACRDRIPEASAPAPRASVSPEVADPIPWFDGSVEQAFDKARVERRPVFLYWGAVWCPPCHALRAKLFSRPEFQARLAATVPVYLDGDTERAQIWGERLGTEGYPTVIVFDADGREVTRLPSYLPFSQYAELLGQALDSTRPVSEVLAAADAGGPASLPPAELTLLAFYAWEQDHDLGLDPARSRALARRFWHETPDDRPVEKARFLALLLQAMAGTGDDPAVSADERGALEAGLRELLSDRTRRNTNLDLVLYAAPDTVRLLFPEAGAQRDSLIAAWDAAARAVEDDPALSTDDRLTALLPQIQLSELASSAGEGVPATLRDRVRERVRWAGTQVRDEDELQAVMSTMAGLLEDAGLAGEAQALLAERLADTTAPYYYVSWLAGLKAKAGESAEAVALYRRAWTQARATGGATAMTSFRWGSGYLRQALRRTPEAIGAIGTDTTAILADLVSGPDAFAGGNWSRLEGLADALREWSKDDPERIRVLDAARRQVGAACERFSDEGPDSPGDRCRSFLGP